MSAPKSRVLLLVGTDHHPFDRAIQWMDAWARVHPDVEVIVQHGQSSAPALASGREFLSRDELVALIASSRAVVTHGGPATIAEVRAAGHRPVVIPRDPTKGEHVDDHQLRFTARLSEKGMIDRPMDEADFRRTLDAASERGPRAATDADALVGASVERFAELVSLARAGGPLRGADAPVVVYIAGFGRSGSTLLERLLGEVPGVSCLGEVVHLWERGVQRDELCGCGQPFSRCATWTAIGERAFGGWDRVDVGAVLRLRDEVDRQRRIPQVAAPAVSRGTRRALSEYGAYYAAVYRAAAELGGHQVIVDSSKHASLAFALSHDADLDLRVIHLVRDPRAVAFSWSKEVERPETVGAGGGEFMPQYSARASGRRWLTTNLLVDGLRLRGLPVTMLRYEDLVRAPAAGVAGVGAALRIPYPMTVPMDGDRVTLRTSHSVAGNPMRFRTGPITVRNDDAWLRLMPDDERRLVSVMTEPLRRWYGRRRANLG